MNELVFGGVLIFEGTFTEDSGKVITWKNLGIFCGIPGVPGGSDLRSWKVFKGVYSPELYDLFRAMEPGTRFIPICNTYGKIYGIDSAKR